MSDSPTAPSSPVSVVLGGSGAIGGSLVRELARRGRPVRAVSRSAALPAGVQAGPSVQPVAADVTDPAQVAAAAEGAEVVYNAAQTDYTRWSQDFPPLNRAVIEGVARAGAKLVVADNLYLYGHTHGRAMTEDMPAAATDRKGRTRAAMAGELLDAHAAGRVRVALGRPSSYYGPGGLRSINYGAQVLGPAVAGRPAQWLGPLDVPHATSYLPDVARALIVLGDDHAADGRAWHLPNAEPLTGEQFLRLVFDAAGTDCAVQAADRTALEHMAGDNPFLAEVLDSFFHIEEPWLVDHGRFEATFGPFAVTPHRAAIAATVDWFRRAPIPQAA
jgi:nucleoside-diphosphate-sugar epimerase